MGKLRVFLGALVLSGGLLAAMVAPAAASPLHHGVTRCNHYGALAQEVQAAISDAQYSYANSSDDAALAQLHTDLTHFYNCGQVGIFRSAVYRVGDPGLLAYVNHWIAVWF